MPKDTRTSLTVTVFILLFVLNILLQMLLSGEPLGRMFLGVFTTLAGLFHFIAATVRWSVDYFISPIAFYLTGIVIAMEFLILPLLVRYRYITFRLNFFVSILAALYLWLGFRIMAVIFG